VAAVTKTGAWATHVVLDARDVVAVPAELDPAQAETVLVNGITAWQMLHRKARVKRGQTVLVHGAGGGVGTILVQLAAHAGIRVIGTASPRDHAVVRGLGAEPVDYRDPDLPARVRELAPGGVAAVFDHLGGASFKRSFDLLHRGGTLVAYGTASQRDDDGSLLLTFAGVFVRLTAWTVLPNGRRALFYNFWAGRSVRPAAFRRRLAADLTVLLGLLAQGAITGQVAARIPLREAGRALALAESHTVSGKVVIEP
jgi:NADPH2:quinone reductase